MSIWSLRRGDNDDNRMSPHGLGLRSILLSAFLEFNLKAPISFLTLVLGPALLVGIAPSVVITYGRLLFYTSASLGYRPTITLTLLAALVGLALWIGRPLLAMAIDNFWHLHYTLVFPIFVVIRELLRAAVEWLRDPSATALQLDRGRRFGTVLAGVLFAGAGVALAIFVDLRLGLQMIDIRQVQPWVEIRAAMGNAAVFLGLSTAVASLFWIWRELSIKGPVLNWKPLDSVQELPTIRVAHVSDFHMVGERYGIRMECGTYGPRGNLCVRSTMRQLKAIDALTPLDRVLLSGDVTDAGTRSEWAEFVDLLRRNPNLGRRLSFVPGNHDVNVIDRTNPGRLDLPWSVGPALRKLRVVLALDAAQGDRAHVVDHKTGALGPLLRDYLQHGERPNLLRSLAQRGSMRGRKEIAKVWQTIFPMVEPPQGDDKYGAILLNSNASSHLSLTNAIGIVRPSELRALKLILKNYPDRSWILMLHHQLVEYPVTSIAIRERIGLALVNAPDILAAIAPYASRILVIHGHRHKEWIGTCGNIVLCSAPSVTLGGMSKGKCCGSFYVHNLAFPDKGGLHLVSSDEVRLA